MVDEASRFIWGGGRFTEDLARSDALHLVVVRSDLPHALITEIDLSDALRCPGVERAITADDLAPLARIPIRVGPTPRLESRLQPVLARERVRYVGEPIAALLAESPAAAADAAEAIRIELVPLAAVDTSTGPALWDDYADNTQIEVEARYGPIEEVTSRADLVFDFEFTTSRRTGLPIETRQLMAEWVEDDLHLWGPTKFLQFTCRTLAGMFGIAPERVVPHKVDVGGMFGVRGEVYPEDYLVAWAARASGKMVRWHEGRREHLLSINHSGEQHHLLRVALEDSGELLGLSDQVVLDMGAYPRPIGSRIPHIIVETLPGPYRWEAVDLRCRGMATSKTPIGTIRGPAAFETTFVRERMIEAVAARLGVTPLEMRRKNLIGSASLPYGVPFEPPADPVVYDSGDFPHMVDHFASLAGYERLHRDCQRRRAEGEAVGLGWGLSVVHSGLGREESVSLVLEEEGAFRLHTSAADVGQGLEATISSLLSHGLGVDPGTVTVVSGDATVPGNGTFSSRSTIFVGSATMAAAEELKRLARERAGQTLGVPPARIRLTATGAEADMKALTWKELAPLTATGEFGMEHPTYGLALHLAQVKVDTETGEVLPEHLWVGYDCGIAVDRRKVVDQLVGAALAGVGGAIHERLVFEDTIPVSATLADYLVPRAADAPELHAYVFELGSPGNPLGAKGAGEAGLIGAGAAVANAVADALGSAGDAISRLPLRSEEVFAAIRSGTQQDGAR
ncbi:MAG TPA: xanthine dehydrogenase family protein molybdopterin-binding subunit [Acidimicrobiia bacterium]|nr:xanthine dehydrogenase family protein molybdopterin-binding subunit [Acidimicrobiia bacterium]